MVGTASDTPSGTKKAKLIKPTLKVMHTKLLK